LPNIGLLLQEMRGEAVPQRMNADPLGDAGTPGCQANDPMQLAPSYAARSSRETTRADRETSNPSCAQRATIHAISQEGGRENDVSILIADVDATHLN
jgi:hypothetical protein